MRGIEAFLGIPPANYSNSLLKALANHHSAVGWNAITDLEASNGDEAAAGGLAVDASEAPAGPPIASQQYSSAHGNSSGINDMPMLPESRALLDQLWMDDCIYMRDTLGLCFATCCANVNQTSAAPSKFQSSSSARLSGLQVSRHLAQQHVRKRGVTL